ncbi:MAG: hypothetical protein KAX80_01455 [Planctomycetes bacterium]|nr:hypothetical protein [Planctomycetota bacterium]
MNFIAGCVLIGVWLAGSGLFLYSFTRRVRAVDRELWKKLTTSGLYPEGGAPFGNNYLFFWLLKLPTKLRSDLRLQLIRFGFVGFAIVCVLLMRHLL